LFIFSSYYQLCLYDCTIFYEKNELKCSVPQVVQINMTMVTNRIRDYVGPIVEKLTIWYNIHYADNTFIQEEWEKEQEDCIADCYQNMTPAQQSELLYFYSIDDIIQQSIKRFGKPFYILDYQIVTTNPNYVSLQHIGFTSSLLEQLLWSEIQSHVYFITHSNT